VSTRIGIVGLPNAGKSSLFNALTRAEAPTANYPFTTIEPNVAVVPVVDQRLDTIDFNDIAGLVAGAHRGEGLGNQFLARIRETHAIVHVVRAHHDDRVVHPDGEVNPLRDIETVETELALADLEQAGRRAERVTKAAGAGGGRDALAEAAWLGDVIATLEQGKPARSVPVPDAARNAASNLGLLTAKPVLFVANVDEGATEVPAEVVGHARAQDAPVLAISVRTEAELAELDEEEAAAMRRELDAGAESGLERLVRSAFDLLHLVAFFTAHESKPAQSWHLRDGGRAWDAAGEIHSDFQKGFVRAEVIGWRDLVDAAGYSGGRDRGLLRLEGRDYVVRDGDVITVRFTR
jgi:GTP-binding protein YchF